MNYKKALNNHLGNLSRSAGLNGATSSYEYILSQNDLQNAWVKAHTDLGYPLKKESARDRYLIYNRQGLENEINKVLTELIQNDLETIVQLIKEDTTVAIQDILDSINVVNNNFVVGISSTSTTHNLSSKLGRLMGKAITKATKKIMDIMTDN